MISPVHAGDVLQAETSMGEEASSNAPTTEAPIVNEGNNGADMNADDGQETGTDQETPPAQQAEQPKTNVTYTDARVYVSSATLDPQANEILVDAYITHDNVVVFSEGL